MTVSTVGLRAFAALGAHKEHRHVPCRSTSAPCSLLRTPTSKSSLFPPGGVLLSNRMLLPFHCLCLKCIHASFGHGARSHGLLLNDQLVGRLLCRLSMSNGEFLSVYIVFSSISRRDKLCVPPDSLLLLVLGPYQDNRAFRIPSLTIVTRAEVTNCSSDWIVLL